MMRTVTRQFGGLALGCLMALLLAAAGSRMTAQGRQSGKDSKAAVSADQAVACVRVAVATKPGDVRALETEAEGGKVICEVEIIAQDGKTYEVEVDVASNAVIEVEEDND